MCVQVIKQLETDFPGELVRTVLTLLASARRGLLECELQGLVKGLPDADDLFPVLRQLRRYLINRAGLLGFYHANLLQAVQRYYLDTEEAQRAVHVHLADYFEAQDYWRELLETQRERARRFPPTLGQRMGAKLMNCPGIISRPSSGTRWSGSSQTWTFSKPRPRQA